ncbi:MAG: hypothetical protein WD688_22960 [Candidatus Binatia bacterium]
MTTRWKQRALRNELVFFVLNTALLVIITTIIVWDLPLIPKTLMRFRVTFVIGVPGGALALIHLLYGLRNTALGIVLIVASVYPLKQLHAAFYSLSNEAQMRSIRYVLKTTSPKEPVMDGQGGVGVFRPHAYFYWLLDPNIRVILTIEEKPKLLAGLQRGEIAPKLINLDNALQDLSPEITRFFEENYEPVNVGSIRSRNTNTEGLAKSGRSVAGTHAR